MIPSAFEYLAPDSASEAVSLLAEDPEHTRVLGGGTWLVPDMNRGEATPRRVVDLRRAGIGGVESVDGRVRLGATCTYGELLESSFSALLHAMASGVTGGRQIVCQGTLGGSAGAARPQSDVPATLVVLGAEVVILGTAGERRIPASELFAAAMRTSLAADEIIVAFELDPAPGARSGYVKLKRGQSSWPIATAACLLWLDGDGRCERVALALGGVAEVPLLVDVSGPLVGTPPTERSLAHAAGLVRDAVSEPWGDVLAPPEYRKAVAGPVARRAIEMAYAAA